MQVKAFLDFDEIGNGLYVVVFDKDEKAASDLIPFQCANLKDGSDNKTRKGLRVQNLMRFAMSTDQRGIHILRIFLRIDNT
jgi:hypothetical protein